MKETVLFLFLSFIILCTSDEIIYPSEITWIRQLQPYRDTPYAGDAFAVWGPNPEAGERRGIISFDLNTITTPINDISSFTLNLKVHSPSNANYPAYSESYLIIGTADPSLTWNSYMGDSARRSSEQLLSGLKYGSMIGEGDTNTAVSTSTTLNDLFMIRDYLPSNGNILTLYIVATSVNTRRDWNDGSPDADKMPYLLAITAGCTNGGTEVEILHLKDVSDGFFSSDLLITGLENVNNIDANTYSIIGNLNREDFVDSDGKYEFRIVYGGTKLAYGQGQLVDPIELHWKQSTWLTDQWGSSIEYAPGYEEISMSLAQNAVQENDYFYGLGRSDVDTCYLDGTGGASDYYNCMGPQSMWSGVGIAGYNNGAAQSEYLYACRTECSDGLFCNGEEYWDPVGSVCKSGVEIVCPIHSYCDNDAATCLRNCDSFAIDEYLNDCSIEFSENELQISSFENDLNDLTEKVNQHDTFLTEIESLQSDLTELIGRVDDNDIDISNINTRISSEINAVNTELDELTNSISLYNTRLTQVEADIAKINQDIAFLSTQITDFGPFTGGRKAIGNEDLFVPSYFNSFQLQDYIIIILFIINGITMAIGCFICTIMDKQKRHQFIQVSTVDTSDANLLKN